MLIHYATALTRQTESREVCQNIKYYLSVVGSETCRVCLQLACAEQQQCWSHNCWYILGRKKWQCDHSDDFHFFYVRSSILKYIKVLFSFSWSICIYVALRNTYYETVEQISILLEYKKISHALTSKQKPSFQRAQ